MSDAESDVEQQPPAAAGQQQPDHTQWTAHWDPDHGTGYWFNNVTGLAMWSLDVDGQTLIPLDVHSSADLKLAWRAGVPAHQAPCPQNNPQPPGPAPHQLPRPSVRSCKPSDDDDVQLYLMS